ncbi:hypothetical protein [Candidatus Lokiarchaeum ossiferum]|uniref:hypothetical protein n=1 Tax=Candidatus Lokiarchaeum ossiferum TaxID=2951803 RepID=UPI00352CFBE9
MNKKLIKIVLAIYWGINFIFVLLYGIFDAILPYLIPKLKKEKEIDNLSDQKDNVKHFFIVITIPAVSILLYIIIGGISLLYIITAYAVTDIVVVFIMMFNQKSHLAFNEKESSIMNDFKEFIVILIINIIGYVIITIIFGAFFTLGFSIFILADSILVFSLMVFLKRIKEESKIIGKVVKNRDLLDFKSENPEKILENIQKIEKMADTSMSNKNFELAEKYYTNLQLKYETLIKIYQKDQNKPKILKLKPQFLKIKTQIYKIQAVNYEKYYDEKIKMIKSSQLDKKKKKNKGEYQEIFDKTEEQLIKAKKNRSKSDVEKYSQRLIDLKKYL